jgi:hypothetical protein
MTGALATGCASTAKGVQASTFVATAGPDVTLTQSAPKGTALAIVRYPAFIEDDAEADFAQAYSNRAIGGGSGGSDTIETQALADSVILKSNFFAMSLYRELASRLPEHSVLLSPHRITKASDGSLTSEPITQAESIASVVMVDFTAYSFPDMEKMMGDKPLTFGDLVTPIVTVRTDPRASVASEGLLMASEPIVSAAAGGNYAQAITDATSLQSGRIEAGVPALDILSHISGTPQIFPATQSLRSRSSDAVKIYPVEKIQLDRTALAVLGSDDTDILEAPFTNGFANQIIQMINTTDVTKATMVRRADVIADYDESLAALTLVGSNDPDYLTRFRYAERLLEAEQKYLSVQSLRLYDGVINGEMGGQVRDMLKEEYRVLERRRQLARQQNIATVAAFAAVLGGVAIASQDNNGRGSSIGQQLAVQAMIQGAIFATTEAIRKNKQSKTVGTNYLEAVVPALNAQTEIQVDLIDSSETITAIRFEDLKAKLGELYANNQRALDTVATRCAYQGPIEAGTWLGACENGVGNGSGVGIFRNVDGDLVEHYGYARDGLADGPGYRIIRAPNGSYAIEGNFSGGTANGTVQVARSGSVALRQYSQDRDMGAAPAGSPIASPFRLTSLERGAGTG